jgi:hypothetical protein
MRTLLLAAVAALAFASAASAAPTCTTGKVCGNTCIAKTAVCHIPAVVPHPVCKPGVSQACGNTCISLTKVCHTPTQATLPKP